MAGGSRSKVKKTGSKAKKLPPFPAIHLVTAQWALCFAFLYGGVAFRALNATTGHSGGCYQPARADAAEAAALLRALLWCSAPQAAAAALALLLPPGSRRRRALAFAELAATAVNHGILTRLLGLLRAAAPPGDVILLSVGTQVTRVALATDLLGFLALLIGGQRGLITSPRSQLTTTTCCSLHLHCSTACLC